MARRITPRRVNPKRLTRRKAKPRMAGKIFTKKRAAERKEPPIIELKNVHRTYQHTAEPVRALRGVGLAIDRGDMVAIMGPSGSGKTTLLNMIGLLDFPDQGKVLYQGDDISQIKRRKLAAFRQKQVGFVFQQKNLIPTLTAFENVYLPFKYSRGKRAIKQEQARALFTCPHFHADCAVPVQESEHDLTAFFYFDGGAPGAVPVNKLEFTYTDLLKRFLAGTGPAWEHCCHANHEQNCFHISICF